MNKILARLSQMSAQRALIVGVLASAFFYFFMFDGGESLDQKAAQVQVQVDVEQKKVKESEAAIKKLEEIRSSVNSLHEQFKVASQQLPADVKASEILKTVDTLARSAGVSVKSAEPRPIVKEDIVEKFPLHVKLQGTYSEITMFLYYISIMERITRVSNFTLAPITGADESHVKPGELNFEGEIMSYRYVAETKAPDAEVKK